MFEININKTVNDAIKIIEKYTFQFSILLKVILWLYPIFSCQVISPFCSKNFPVNFAKISFIYSSHIYEEQGKLSDVCIFD